MADNLYDYTEQQNNEIDCSPIKVEVTDYNELEEEVKVKVLTGIEVAGSLPQGGKKGQVLTKNSDDVNDASWSDELNIKSLNVSGNTVIEGNLKVQGTTTTINQETLTIKDNLIAVNSEATTSENIDVMGVIAVVDNKKAYASPVYDIKEKVLKIGLGTYVKNDKGNIVSFVFDNDESKTVATEQWLPLDKLNSTSFATKTLDEAAKNIITAQESAAIGESITIQAKRSLSVGIRNLILVNDELDIGGSNNLVSGADNTVVASTGVTIGNSNTVGDIDGKGIAKVANQVNQTAIFGYKHNVQLTTRSLISGEQHTIVNTNDSLVSGKNNNLINFSSVNLLGERLTATANFQTLVGYGNDLNDTSIFAVACGLDKNAFAVSRESVISNCKLLAKNGIETNTITSLNESFFTKINCDYVECDETSTFNKDINVKRGLYCPNIFKGTNSEDNKVLSKKEVIELIETSISSDNTADKEYIDNLLVDLLKLVNGLTTEQIVALNTFAKNLTVEA